MNILSKLMNYFEGDPRDYFGVGPFKPLPVDHPFQRAAFLHDYAFDCSHAGKEEESRASADEKLFWRMTLLAHNQIDPKKRCELMMDICEYWPLARKLGGFFWEGKE
jgi:hypothetical protein